MNFKVLKFFFPLLVLLNTVVSPNQWSEFPIGGTTFTWVVDFLIIIIAIWIGYNYFNVSNKKDYLVIKLYFIWMCFCTVRGAFVAEDYWEWKQWVGGTLSLTLPIFVYIYSNPIVLFFVLKFWVKYAIPLFFLFFYWNLTSDAYHFYLSPILLLGCFLPVISRKWRIILLCLIILMVFADFGARSQVIKALVVLIINIVYIFSGYISKKLFKAAHWSIYFATITALILGITGEFNIFKDFNKKENKYIEKKIVNGQIVEDDLTSDTRTFIYEEVIRSSLKNGYVFFGRTPARGNDSETFGINNAEVLKNGKFERHRNEVCFPNIFTWLGLIGLILYCMIYIKSSCLCIYRSNNIYMKLIGLFIAFRFFYGWIEDINDFSILSFTIWMMIGMGFSEKFRSMRDEDFKLWITFIFKNKIIKNESIVVV